MKILSTRQHSVEEILGMIERERSRGSADPSLEAAVRQIIEQTRTEGDAALYRLAEKLDGVKLSSLKVSPEEIKNAYDKTDPVLLAAMKKAKSNIEKFHKTTFTKKEKPVQTQKGVVVWREFRPIESVGLYVPGGKAAYPSTVLMLAVPAKIAGCERIVLCTPAGKDGNCNRAVLAAAHLCGVGDVFKIGGAQAIAAMAYGTQTVPKALKIFGPGNAYVTSAKMQVYGEVDIDMPAGPSEVLVMADDRSNPRFAAADLLSQLEHGEDSQGVLVSFSEAFARRVLAEIERQIPGRSRKEIIGISLSKSFAVVVASADEACRLANAYAPEHLEIMGKHKEAIVKKINNAGSVFLGDYANEPLGDYATGANHTLPTSGYARMFSALSAASFGKMIQFQKVSKQGIAGLRSTVETLAESEGLDAHRHAVEARFS